MEENDQEKIPIDEVLEIHAFDLKDLNPFLNIAFFFPN